MGFSARTGKNQEDAPERDCRANGQRYLVAAHERGTGNMSRQDAGRTSDGLGHCEGTAERAENCLCSGRRHVLAGK
jgi:hypothetical protein